MQPGLSLQRIVFYLFVCWTGSLQADTDYGQARVTAVTSIYDADTFRANITGWPAIIGERIPIRLRGIDAPEIKGQCEAEKIAARKAKQFTVAALRGAQVIELRDIQRGKYFRILARVYVDDQDLAAKLIEAGLARAYEGGKRQGWCHHDKDGNVSILLPPPNLRLISVTNSQYSINHNISKACKQEDVTG